MSRGRQHRPRSRTPPARAPPETVEALWRRRWNAAATRFEQVNYLFADFEVGLPADTRADLGAKLAALVSLWQHGAEALHVPFMLEDEGRGVGDASPPGPGTRS